MFKKLICFMLVSILLIPSFNTKAIINENEKVVYLTFDDGPSKNTPRVLDILKEHDVKATFFVVGPLIESDTQYLKRTHDEGHAIGNHTYDHDFEDIYISEKAFWSNYEKCQEYIKSITGEESKLFRFPGGSFNHEVSRRNGKDFNRKIGNILNERGVSFFDWDIDSGDGMRNDTSTDCMLNNIKKEMKICKDKNNVIVLMHDSAKKDSTVNALSSVIKFFKDEGYIFKTLRDYK